MDSHLRQLIRQAQQSPETAAANLTEVFTNIKSILADKKPNESLPIGFDIFVLLAEEAVKNGLDDISKECLRIYLSLDAPNNQFRARAFLAQAKLLQPSCSEHPEALEKPVAYVLKTIELCRKTPKYHFLVFNASVVYSELVRPFLKPHFRRFLCQSLSQVVKALEAIDDKDYEWRAELLKILLECYLDAGLRKEALLLAEQAANFVTKNVPGHFKDLLELISVNSLGEHGKLQWWIRGSAELAIYYKLCKLKVAIKERDAEVQPAQEMAKIYRQLLAEDDVTVQAPKGKKDAKKPQGAAGKSDAPAISTKRLSQHSREKPKLLLELARLAVDQSQFELATQCLTAIKACPPLPEQHFYTEVEFLNCYFIVKKLADRMSAGVCGDGDSADSRQMRLEDSMRQWTVIFVDATWHQANAMVNDERLRGVPRVALSNHTSHYWRYEAGLTPSHLSTIEAIYYFAVDLHVALVKLGYWAGAPDAESGYDGRYDNLLLYFNHLYRLLYASYDGGRACGERKRRHFRLQ